MISIGKLGIGPFPAIGLLYFEPVEKVILEFEREKRLNLDEVDTGTLEGKRVRSELLVRLKERAGLKYREIAEFDIFGDLGLSGLRAIYKNYRNQ